MSPREPQDLAALLAVDEIGPLRYRNRHHDSGFNGRSYGGQVLGQAVMAAGRSVPEGRRLAAIQLMFLRGTRVTEPIDYIVTPLQEGKRFSAFNVRGVQGAAISLDAHLSFCTELDGPSHMTVGPHGVPAPEDLAPLSACSPELRRRLDWVGAYSLDVKPSIDFRPVQPSLQMLAALAWTPMQFWLRASQPVPGLPHLQEAAFAYLSDWWSNFSSLSPHLVDGVDESKLSMVSLNHSLWLHRRHDAHDWLLADSTSPVAAQGRGMCHLSYYDRAGNLVATVAQECLMAPQSGG